MPKQVHQCGQCDARMRIYGHIRIPREFARPKKSYYGKRRTESASAATPNFALRGRLSARDPNPVPEIRATFPRVGGES